MKYIIVEGFNQQQIVEKVNMQLKVGWELYGHPFVIEQRGEVEICQAMIKNEVDEIQPDVPVPQGPLYVDYNPGLTD